MMNLGAFKNAIWSKIISSNALLLKPIMGKIDILFALSVNPNKANKISIFPIMGFKRSAVLIPSLTNLLGADMLS